MRKLHKTGESEPTSEHSGHKPDNPKFVPRTTQLNQSLVDHPLGYEPVERRNTGKGQFIELAIGEATMCQLADAIMTYTMNGLVQKPIGNRHPVYAPCGCYLCKGEDKWVNITVTSEDEWRGLCQAMGNPAWCNEKRFKNESSRYINQDQLDELITQWTSKHNHYEVMHLLQSKGVPAGAVLDEKEIFADPHIIKRGFFEDCSQKDCGTHKYPGLMWRMSNVPNKIRKPPVRLGEDNEYIYKKIIHLSQQLQLHCEYNLLE